MTGDLSPGANEGANDAVAAYRTYVEQQTKLLGESSAKFIAAVKAGDVAKAKALYGPARDPVRADRAGGRELRQPRPQDRRARGRRARRRVDGLPPDRAGALGRRARSPAWARSPTSCTTDIGELQARVQTVELEPAQIANGAVELLGEVSKSKITGEEERYSHTDLVDFEANVDGAHAAFNALRPLVAESDPALADTIDQRFDDVITALSRTAAATASSPTRR